MVMFDVTCRKSFENLDHWINEFGRISQVEAMIICGNKIDDEERRQVSSQVWLPLFVDSH